MELVPIKISELKDGAKYHVFDKETRIYYSSKYCTERKSFVTNEASCADIDNIRPLEIKAIGAEVMTHEEACKTASVVNIVIE